MKGKNIGNLTLVLISALLLPGHLFGLDVAEDELGRTADEEIEFVNYEGPVSVSESVDMIRSIGEFLGRDELADRDSREYFGRYRVERAVDPDVTDGFDADIFVVLPQARVDHIRNLRLMVSGYLETAYDYSADGAGLIAELATIYNAVYRGELSNFEERYKPVVYERLSTESVGLSTVYNDWPGNTQMVIPLRRGRALVDPFELADDVVIGDLREREDMGIAERRALVSLMEDVIEIEREEIVAERERFAADLEELEDRERELLREREALERLSEEERAEAEQRMRLSQEALSQRMAALADRAETIEELEDDVEEMEERVQAERDVIAQDRDELLDDDEVETADLDPADEEVDDEEIAEADEIAALEAPRDTVDLIEVSRVGRHQTGQSSDEAALEDGAVDSAGHDALPTGRIARVFVDNARVSHRSAIDRITSRQLREFREGYLVIEGLSDTTGRLVRVDQRDLEEVTSSQEEVFNRSSIAIVDGDAVFAVVHDDSQWRIGRFSADLELESLSTVTVDRHTFIVVHDDFLVVQADADTFAVLSQDNLDEEQEDP